MSCVYAKGVETHVVEFITVFGAVAVDDAFTVALVAEVAALVFEVVFDLFLDVEIVEVFHDFKQAVRILKQSPPINDGCSIMTIRV